MAVHPFRLRSPLDAPEPRRIRAVTSRVMSIGATAALLLLTAAVGIVPLLQQTPPAPPPPGWTPALVGAMRTAPGNVGDVVLAEAVFGLDQLPPRAKEVVFYRLTIPPGEILTALAGPSCSCPGWPVNGGVGVEVVQAGHYGILLAAPMEVHRRGGVSREAVEADTEMVLGPGDAAIYPDYTAAAEIRVVGDAPVQLIGVAILGSDGSGVPAPMLPDRVRGEEFSRSLAADWERVAGGPVGVSLRQVTLPAGLHVGPYEPVGLEAMRVESGEISRFYFEPGAAEPNGPAMHWYEGRVAPLLGIRPGMRYDMTSSGAEPTELLVLIIEPVGVTARTLSP